MTGVIAGNAARPLPTPFEWDRGFWEAARQHQLVVQYCTACKSVRSFPRLMCPACRSLEFDWLKASGNGRLYSWSTLYKSFHPGFVDLPRTIAIVELEDFPQVHLVSGLQLEQGMTESDLRTGQPVEVFFTDASESISLPEFRLVKS